jgi:hypothetical protein
MFLAGSPVVMTTVRGAMKKDIRTFMKVVVALIYLGLFVYQIFQYWDVMYS